MTEHNVAQHNSLRVRIYNLYNYFKIESAKLKIGEVLHQLNAYINQRKKTNGPAWIDFIFYFNHAFGSSKNCHNYKTQYNGGNRVGKNKQPNAVYEY